MSGGQRLSGLDGGDSEVTGFAGDQQVTVGVVLASGGRGFPSVSVELESGCSSEDGGDAREGREILIWGAMIVYVVTLISFWVILNEWAI